MDLLDRLLGHDDWATTQLLDVCSALTDAQLDQEADVGHRTLRDTFDHLIYNVDAWTALMAQQPMVTERTEHPSIAELIERHRTAHAFFAGAARDLRDSGNLDGTFLDHYQYRQTNGGTIIHVIAHNTEHRTEALHILNRLGVSDVTEVDPQIWEHKTGII
jgi:uncharacterized damage-inducible protein DinB